MKLKPLRFWMNGPNAQSLARLYQAWWTQVLKWTCWPREQIDVDHASLNVVDLMAWQRSVRRLATEPEWLYRRRVKYAKVNADDAGSVAGFKRIWRRLGLGELAINERLPDRDWDVIQLEVTENLLSANSELLQELISMYGRTCRRYEYSTVLSLDFFVDAEVWAHEFSNSVAALERL